MPWVFLVLCVAGMNTFVHCADNWQTSDFWNRAKTTSDLSILRQTEVPPVFKRTVPFVAADPAFFPLCGNGVLNTKEDYLRLYGPNLESIPMMRYSKEFLSKTFPSIGQGNLNQMYAFTMITDEVCDDGNRRDLDGCSADCMVYDMLTSSCEIAMERQIEIEDVLPVPDSGDMVVSALDGIYLIKEGDFISNSIQKLTLLRAKSFPIKSMYSYAGDLFFYSSIQQKVSMHHYLLKFLLT
jgi:cysteine-rich repeat protein